MEEWAVGKYVGNWDQRKDVENDEKYDGMNVREVLWCWTGNYPNMLIFYKELHRDVHYHPIYSSYIFNDMILAVEAPKQGVTMGEDTVSGLMFADYFVTNSRNTRRIAEK